MLGVQTIQGIAQHGDKHCLWCSDRKDTRPGYAPPPPEIVEMKRLAANQWCQPPPQPPPPIPLAIADYRASKAAIPKPPPGLALQVKAPPPVLPMQVKAPPPEAGPPPTRTAPAAWPAMFEPPWAAKSPSPPATVFVNLPQPPPTPVRLDGVRFERILRCFADVNEKLDQVTARLDNQNTGMEQVTARLDNVNTGMEQVMARLDNVNTGMDELRTQLKKLGNDECAQAQQETQQAETNAPVMAELDNVNTGIGWMSTQLKKFANDECAPAQQAEHTQQAESEQAATDGLGNSDSSGTLL